MNYVKSLSNKANFFFEAENFDEAVRIGKEKLLILEQIQGQDSLEYAISEAELALYISNTGHYKDAIILAERAIQKIEKIEGKESAFYVVTAEKLSAYYTLIEDYEKALAYIQQAITSYEKTNGKDSDYYMSLKASLATTYTKLYRIQEAIEIQNECNEYFFSKGDSIEYAKGLHDISISYAESGDYSKALSCCKTASSMFLDHFGPSNFIYRASLITLAGYYAELGEFDNVHRVCTIYVQLCKQYCGENSRDYIAALSNHAFYYGKEGNYKKAIEIEEQAFSLQQSGTVTDSLDYAITLSNLASFYRGMGFVDKAITLDEQSLDILNAYPTTKAYRGVLSDLSSCYLSLGDYEKSIELINTVLNSFHDRKGTEYYGYLYNLANCYYMINQIPKAIDINNEVLKNQAILKGKKNLDYASTLEHLASCYARMDRYREAIIAQTESLEILLSILGKDNTKCAFSFFALGYYYRCIGEEKKAEDLRDKAVESLRNSNFSENGTLYLEAVDQLVTNYVYDNPEYALKMVEEIHSLLTKNFDTITRTHIRCLLHLIQIYKNLGQFDKAKRICYKEFETPQIYDYFSKDINEYLNFLHAKTWLNFDSHDYANAVISAKEALEISKSIDNKADEYSIINLLYCYLALNDTATAIGTIKEYNLIEETRNKIQLNLNSLTAKNRYSYWNNNSMLYTYILPLLAIISKDSTLICQTYDYSALFAKCLLLRNEIRVSESIRNSKDDSLRLKYIKYQENLSLINNSSLDSVKRSDLSKKNDKLEDEIRQRLLSLHLITEDYATWKDVQQCLEQDDVAIEFLSVQLGNDTRQSKHDIQIYIALVNKKEYSHPHIYALFEGDELVVAKSNGSSALFNLIWEPLKKELEYVKNIFFAPAGELHNIGIEYLNDSTGHYLFDKYTIYRLSSTQELLHSHLSTSLQSAALFGGLDYSVSHSSLLKRENNPEENNYDTNFSYRDLKHSISKRGGFDPIYGTGTEIKEITELLQKNNIKCQAYTGDKGTEDSFKSIVKTRPNILHVATHGMYIKKEEKNTLVRKNNFSFVLPEDDENLNPENIALTRSFIVMSGGNQLIQRDSIPLNNEDGIITAQEISQMELDNTNLVVLSACQTGLGDISNEGVYGLQRGFKKAGVNTILMSLGKVDDEATKLLMVEFYRNLMNGKTKHQSLKEAQQYLRKVENGKYDDPKYWASFIMLDGLD